MKPLIKSLAAGAAVLFFQAAQAQIGVKASSHAAANATLNASKATHAAVNATNKATVATGNALKATTGAVKTSTDAAVKTGEKVKHNTSADVDADVKVKTKNDAKVNTNSNAGGEEKGLIRAASVSEAESHASANATLPMAEVKDEMKAGSEEAKEKADKIKKAAVKTEAETKEKIKSTHPTVKASGEVKTQGSVKAGKQ